MRINWKYTICILLTIPTFILAQQKTISGTVYDASTNFPLTNVEVSIQGTGEIVLTDIDGKYSISAEKGDVLEFYSLDFELSTAIVGDGIIVNNSLQPSSGSLQELVVIGYGSEKKMDLTGAISSVDGAALAKTPTGQTVQALQGQVAGVQISNFGSPGESGEINIRGRNSIEGSSTPLYVVDGMFFDSIDFLDPNQIETLTVLKDASSSAIYGVAAANGVIVITTKNGSYNRKPQITYSGYYGFQYANDVLQMANAEQFTNFALESGSVDEIASIDAAMQRFGRSRTNPNIPDVNTDWYKETLRIAPILNQNINISGGSEKVSYNLGGDFFKQEGILKMKNQYSRYNFNGRLDAKVNNWLDAGTDLLYSRARKYNDEQSAWQQIYGAVPILPLYDYNFTEADPTPYSDAKILGYRGHQNPFALLDNSNLRGDQSRFNGSVYLDFKLIPKKLSARTSFYYTNLNENNRIVYLPYFVTDSYQRSYNESSITRSNLFQENYIWDNVLTYENQWGDHNLTLMGGTSFRANNTVYNGVTGYFDESTAFVRDKESTWYIQNTLTDGRTSYDGGYKLYSTSFFGRASYKFKDKYLAYVTLRSEGSSKFENDYINLPAVGLGWVISKENFMTNAAFINFLKLRAGWGRLANINVRENRSQSATTHESVFNNVLVPGFTFATYNDNVKWEYTEELNLGLSSNLLKNRMSLEFDYFDKKTPNLVIPVQPEIGNSVSYLNVGGIQNKGIEIAMGWNDKIGDNWRYGINTNFSTVKNKVTNLFGQTNLLRGSAEFRQLLEVGKPMDIFYGYVIEGVYQNDDEIANDPVAAAAIAAGTTIKPGFFRYKDLNNDNIIDAQDRTNIGSPIPTYFYGGNLSLGYKNWDFSLNFYGQGGNVILNRNRGEVIWTQGNNVDADLAKNRWRGEGSTNEFPSSEGYRNLWNQKLSKFFLSDGDFFRLQNIQLSYTLRTSYLPEMKLWITADRPYLWTKSYNGMNPEVGFDGIDFQTYPTPSSVSVGYSINF